jgi:AcrR family transcriptional regulator
MMARIVNKVEHEARRNEILDASQRFIYTEGYEQMTIQEIVDDLQISKGAFYHYFDSKQALLEALIERLLTQAEQIILPIVQDENLPALEKIQRIFSTISRWKASQKEYLLALLSVWYSDDNAIVRQKMLTATITSIAPLLTLAIRQGLQEGVLTTPYPDQAGQVLLSLFQGLGEILGKLLFTPESNDLQYIENTITAYTDALERVLGAPHGSIVIMDAITIKEWFATPVTSEPALAGK